MPCRWPFTNTPTREAHELLDRAHPSWRAFEVARSASSAEEAAARLRPRFDIPGEVLEQWICGLFWDEDTLANYAWIDYDRARFVLESWPTERLCALRVIGEFWGFVDGWARADTTLARTFPFGGSRKDAWTERGTWNVPPVVIDPVGFGLPPRGADLLGIPQIVEGHTRLGHLRRFARLGPSSGVTVASEHLVYVLRAA